MKKDRKRETIVLVIVQREWLDRQKKGQESIKDVKKRGIGKNLLLKVSLIKTLVISLQREKKE